MFANGQSYYSLFGKKISVAYYDLFAYVPYGSDEYELNNIQMMDNATRVDRLIKKSDYIKCNSAFGGMGIYRYHSVEKAGYAAVRNTKSRYFPHLCEHVGFNQTCSTHGSLYISKRMGLFYERLSFKRLCFVLLRKILGYEMLMKIRIAISEKILRKQVNHDYY